MSRREGRDSHAKRLHSRSEREPSPKKSRRDGKQATERTYSSSRHMDIGTTDQEQKQLRSLQDALPLETPAPEPSVQPDSIKENSTRKIDGVPDGKRPSLDPKVPRSRSYFKHGERGSAGHNGRSSGRSETDHERRSRDRLKDKVEPHQCRADLRNVWRHDGFLELETEVPPQRKRPAFREKKIDPSTETDAGLKGTESTLPTAKREDRSHYSRALENKVDGLVRGDDERSLRTQRGGYQSREMLSGGGTRGRDRFNRRYSERGVSANQTGRLQVEKWKHDLYDEANRSPTAQNEEEQIAKVEALLAL